MKILSWNIKWEFQTRQERRFNKIVDGVKQITADIIGLQEVDKDLLESFTPEFKTLGYRVLSYEFDEKPYCNLVLSKYPASKSTGRSVNLCFPKLLSRARVKTPKGEVDFFNCHIPNGSQHGFEKIRTIDALLTKLEKTKGTVRIVVGDFNEPRSESDQGIESWAYKTNPKKDRPSKKQRDHWDSTVNKLFKGEQRHGMRDTHGYKAGSFTHIRGRGRSKTQCRYDHIFCSKHFRILSCKPLHDSPLEQASDHSPLVAKLGFLRRP